MTSFRRPAVCSSLIVAALLGACSGDDPASSEPPPLSAPIKTYGAEEFVSSGQLRGLRAPDGTLHYFLRYSDVADATSLHIVSREYGDHFWSEDDGATWNQQAVYATSFLNVQDGSPLETEGHLFHAGGDVFATSGAEMHRLGASGWGPADVATVNPVNGDLGFIEIETDPSGTAHMLRAHKPGHVPQLVRFDGTEVVEISIQDETVTKTRPETRAEIAAAADGSTDVVWVGLDDFNIEDPGWEQVLHHVSVSPSGELDGEEKLELVRAWWQAGGLHHPRVVDLDMVWSGDVLHLFVTAAEVAAGEDTPLSEILTYGVLYTSFDGSAWSAPSLVASGDEPLLVHATVGAQAGDAVWIAEAPLGAESASRWRTAKLGASGLGVWRRAAKTDALASDAPLFPRQLIHRGGDAMAALLVRDRQVLSTRYERALEGDADLHIVRAVATSPTAIAVSFDRPIDPASADLDAITVEGVEVIDRVLDAVGSTVILRTAPQTAGATYTVDAEGLVGTGRASASTTGYGAQPLSFVDVQSPFRDAPRVLVDTAGRVFTGNADLDGMNYLRADWTTIDRLPMPPTPVSPNALTTLVELDGDVWISHGERLQQWDGSSWTEHAQEIEADRTARVLDVDVAGGKLYALFGYATKTVIHVWDGEAWSALPEAPSTLQAMHVADDGTVVAAAGTLGTFGVYQDQIHRFDGVSWSSEALVVEAQLVAKDVQVDAHGAVFLSGVGKSPNGSNIVWTAIKQDGVVTELGTQALSPKGGALITTPGGEVAVVDDGVRTWTGSSWSLVDGTEGAAAAAYDPYGNIWITTKAAGGMAGHRGLVFVGAP